jgi:hypothetical protein
MGQDTLERTVAVTVGVKVRVAMTAGRGSNSNGPDRRLLRVVAWRVPLPALMALGTFGRALHMSGSRLCGWI